MERSNVHQNKTTEISQRTERITRHTGQDLARNLKFCLSHRTKSSRYLEEIACHTGQIKASTQRGLLAMQQKIKSVL